MNKEKKYTSLELSKKIYDLAKKKGIELPESELKYFHGEWNNRKIDDVGCEIKNNWGLNRNYNNNQYTDWLLPALDTAELGEILPKQTIIRKEFIRSTDNILYVVFPPAPPELTEIIFDKNLTEAMGKMYFYLLYNNLL